MDAEARLLKAMAADSSARAALSTRRVIVTPVHEKVPCGTTF